MLRFTKMELLKLELERSLEDEAEKLPESEIKVYYQKNAKNFEQISVLRIFVPKVKQIQPKEGATPAETDAARKDSENGHGQGCRGSPHSGRRRRRLRQVTEGSI